MVTSLWFCMHMCLYSCSWLYNTGSVNNLNKKIENSRSDRKLTARCPDNVDVVTDSFKGGGSPKKTLWRRFQELGLSCTSLQRILKNDLRLYSYRIQIKHKLTPVDMMFLVSVIHHYHINGLHLFWNTLYQSICLFLIAIILSVFENLFYISLLFFEK